MLWVAFWIWIAGFIIILGSSTFICPVALDLRSPALKLITAEHNVLVFGGKKLNFMFGGFGGPLDPNSDCGGCKALQRLWEILQNLGHHVSSSCELKPASEFINIGIHPEIEANNCGKAVDVSVRWILAPLGIKVKKSMSDSWGENDMIWNYGILTNGGVRRVNTSNLLQAQANPYRGDGLDLEAYSQRNRSGTLWMMRKGHMFHKTIVPMHTNADKEVPSDNRAAMIDSYLTSEYLIIYDPYSFHAHMSAMLGCIAIVYPMEGMTKYEWLMTTLYAGYLADNGLTNLMGVAYGNSTSEIEYARRTLPAAREELIRIKEWGETVSVPRFVRDVIRYTAGGARSGFESAMLRSEFYPSGWEKVGRYP